MAEQPRSLILIVIDALRYDCVPGIPQSPHLRRAGLTLPSLPALAQLTDGAYHFTQAIACAPHTPAAFASLFSGLLPPQHGVRAHAATSLHPNVRTLAAILSCAGYCSCAMTDYPEVLAPVGLLQDFGVRLRSEDEALAWWDAYPAQPRFLLLHLWDVHKPYNMPLTPSRASVYPERLAAWHARLHEHGIPEPADLDDQAHPEPERHRVNVMQCLWEQRYGWIAGLKEYLDGLQTFDKGRLRSLVDALQARAALRDAVVIVTSDHGEGRSSEGYGALNHAHDLLDDVLRIPLFVRVPGSAGAAIPDQVSQAAIMPTVLDLLRLADPRSQADARYAGRALAPLLRGQRQPPALAYAELSVAPPARDAARDEESPSVVRFRVLRSATRKIHLTGQVVHADRQRLAAPAETFVRSLYRDVLGRFASAAELAWWLDKLKKEAGAPDIALRRAMLHDFEHSREAGKTPKYAIYDLRRDPLEEHPLVPASSPLLRMEYRRHMAQMDDIERRARPGAPLIAQDGDEEIIRKRMQALGYIE